jgi:hypothetical protein
MALSGQRSRRSEHGVTISVLGDGRTALRLARVRLLDAEASRESWMRQTHLLVRDARDDWRLAMGQGVIMYDGLPLDNSLHARYAGRYDLPDGRRLQVEWQEPALLAILPSGAHTQIFLASPTEEQVRVPAAGAMRFTLAADGSPVSVALVRNGKELWQAIRREGLSNKTGD